MVSGPVEQERSGSSGEVSQGKPVLPAPWERRDEAAAPGPLTLQPIGPMTHYLWGGQPRPWHQGVHPTTRLGVVEHGLSWGPQSSAERCD